MNCPSCRSVNPPGMKFCVSCGTEMSLSQSKLAESQAHQPTHHSCKQDGVVRCRQCGLAQDTDAAFCKKCGTSLSVRARESKSTKPERKSSPSWWRETFGLFAMAFRGLWWFLERAIAVLGLGGWLIVVVVQVPARDWGKVFFLTPVTMIAGILTVLIIPNPAGRRMRAWLKKKQWL